MPGARSFVGMPVLLLVAKKILAGVTLFGAIVAPRHTGRPQGFPPSFNVRTQIACEAKILNRMEAREVFSGNAYDALSEVARAYERLIPHIYLLPDSWNMAYLAASRAVDGRGKIVVGQQATVLFDTIALKGFLGHEMAHLVSDTAAKGCKDYIIRDPEMEADADALAARTLGTQPVKAFLERVLALTEDQNFDAKRRFAMLQ
jgi:Zn-dependent protease with chaperone function